MNARMTRLLAAASLAGVLGAGSAARAGAAGADPVMPGPAAAGAPSSLTEGARTFAVPAIHVALDASRAAQRIYTVAVTMPATPGPFTFVYPKWIPGYHGPTGPIEDVVSLHVAAGGTALAWRRDTSDQYAVHVTVPPGASSVEADFGVVAAPSHDGQDAVASSPALAVLEFSNFVVYPEGRPALDQPVAASVRLPAGWGFGTALPVGSRTGDTVAFAPVSLYELVDAPIVTGRNFRAHDLGGGHELDVAADAPDALALTPAFLTGMRHLVAEGPALYGGRHYRDYHFLLSLSDALDVNGIEHHESSDNREAQDYPANDAVLRSLPDLLPHEYSHSWNGKYRRPADLFQPTYQTVERTDLLWVYEGLNQYNGEKLSTRARLNSYADERDQLALTAASLDAESGRLWRPIQDTADAAPVLYQAPSQWSAQRRTAGDFYAEGDLIWLDADVRIRALTHGAKSLDDFCRLYASGGGTTPSVRGYDEAEIVATLDSVAHDDWAAFFKARVADVAPHAPMDGITGGGWRLAFEEKPSSLETAQTSVSKTLDLSYSLGFNVSLDGAATGKITGVLTKSPAFDAGIVPDAVIAAVDGRAFTPDGLESTVRARKGSTVPIQLVIVDKGFYRTVGVDASAGLRYPHLERVAGTPDVLERIYAPLTFVAKPEPRE